MARTFKTGVKFTGDPKGAITATKATRAELDKLTGSQQRHNSIAKVAAQRGRAAATAVAGVAAAAAVAVGAIGRFAKGVADQGDRVQKLSIQLGTSTEFISGMAHAAELSGGSLESFATGMRKMEKSVGDLSAGLSTQVRSFDRIGLTYQKLRNLSPEEQFLAIADGIGRMEDASLRTATAMDIFGRAGGELVPLMVQGKEGIQSMMEEAERLGLVMSKDFADASAQFNDDLTRSKGIVTGIKRSIGEGLLPELTALMQHFIENAEASDTWAKAGQLLGNVVRVLVAGFTILEEMVALAAKTVFAAGKVIVNTLIALSSPVTEFFSTVSTAWKHLTEGEFSAAASAFTGLGDRIKASFVANMGQIKDTLAEFGQDSVAQVGDTVNKVNDILLRTAKVSQDAAAGVSDAGDEISETGEQAEQAGRQLQSLVDRLDPLSRLQRNFGLEQSILRVKIEEGGDQVGYYSELLEKLTEEYESARLEALGFGEDVKKSSDKAAANGAKMVGKLSSQMDILSTAFRRGIERMDDSFQDMWRNVFAGTENSMAALKDIVLDTLAEIAHSVTTRQLSAEISAAFSGGPGNGSGQLGGLFGGLFARGDYSTAPGFIGPPSSLAGSGALAGGSNAAAGAMAIPIIGWIVAAFMTNLSLAKQGWNVEDTLDRKGTMLSDFAGGGPPLLLDKALRSLGLSGNLASILAGTSIFSALFGRKPPKLQSQGIRGSYGGDGVVGEQFFNFKAKGGLFRKDKYTQKTVGFDDDLNEFFDDVIGSIAGFGKDLAARLGIDVNAALDALDISFDLTLSEDPEVAEQQIKDLAEKMGVDIIGAMSSAFGERVQDFVTDTSGVDAQLARLSTAAETLDLINKEASLIDSSFGEFLTVAENMRGWGEDTNDALQRLLQTVRLIADMKLAVQAFADSDIAADFEKLVSSQATTALDIVNAYGVAIRDLGDTFAGSQDDLVQLSQLTAARYQSEIAYLQQIQQISDGITGGFQNLREQIERDLYGDAAYYGKVDQRIEQLSAELNTLSDPSRIASTVAEIQRLSAVAYGLLDEEGQAANGQGILDFIANVEALARSRLETATGSFLTDAESLREYVSELSAGFGDPLEIAATAHEAAALALSQAGQDLSTAANDIPAAIRDGFSGLVLQPRMNLYLNIDGAGQVVSAGIVNR